MSSSTVVAKNKVKVAQKYEQLFNSDLGKEVLNDMMRTHYVASSTFGENINQMIFKEGERNVVLRILHLLNIDPTKAYERIVEYEKSLANE